MEVAIVITFFFFFNDTATTEIYTLSLHDALPIFHTIAGKPFNISSPQQLGKVLFEDLRRSEEHTSELQSRLHLVCRLLLEKKKCSDGSLIKRMSSVGTSSIWVMRSR